MHPSLRGYHQVQLALADIEDDFVAAKKAGLLTDEIRLELRRARKAARSVRDMVGVFPATAEYGAQVNQPGEE